MSPQFQVVARNLCSNDDTKQANRRFAPRQARLGSKTNPLRYAGSQHYLLWSNDRNSLPTAWMGHNHCRHRPRPYADGSQMLPSVWPYSALVYLHCAHLHWQKRPTLAVLSPTYLLSENVYVPWLFCLRHTPLLDLPAPHFSHNDSLQSRVCWTGLSIRSHSCPFP